MKSEPSIRLNRREKTRLEEILATKETTPRERARAQILRLSALGWSVSAITEATGASRSTVGRARRWFRELGLEAALYDAERSGRPATISDSDVQRVVALVCTEPPSGHSRWTVRLLADEVVRRKLIKKISRERIRWILRDHELKPWREKNVVYSSLG
jgi:transposase